MINIAVPVWIALRGADEIHLGILARDLLARELLDDHRVSRISQHAQIFRCQVVEGMGRNDQWKIDDLQMLRRQPGMCQECRGDNGCGWNAAFLEILGIMDTP